MHEFCDVHRCDLVAAMLGDLESSDQYWLERMFPEMFGPPGL